MMDSGPQTSGFVLEGPDPTYLSIVGGLVRGVLQIASGLGFGWALGVTGDQQTMLATAIVMAGTLAWSGYQKIAALRKRRRAAEQSAVRSAQASSQAGTPVAIAVVNPMPTALPDVSADELNRAERRRNELR